MPDDQIVKLLQEIRDLQKQHVEDYKTALKHQEESIALSRDAVERYKRVLKPIRWVVLLIIAILLLLALSVALPWCMRRL